MQLYNRRHPNVPASAVYIGRGSPWGNPFAVGVDGTREHVIRLFREYLESRPDLQKAVKLELRGRSLVCYCAPKACHGSVLLEVANAP